MSKQTNKQKDNGNKVPPILNSPQERYDEYQKNSFEREKERMESEKETMNAIIEGSLKALSDFFLTIENLKKAELENPKKSVTAKNLSIKGKNITINL